MSNSEKAFEVAIAPAGWRFAARADETLLQAAARAGIVLPSSCRNGTCRACLCRTTAGQVDYRIEWPGLSADERREGFILPCVAQPRSDLALEVPGARRAVPQPSAPRNFPLPRP